MLKIPNIFLLFVIVACSPLRSSPLKLSQDNLIDFDNPFRAIEVQIDCPNAIKSNQLEAWELSVTILDIDNGLTIPSEGYAFKTNIGESDDGKFMFSLKIPASEASERQAIETVLSKAIDENEDVSDTDTKLYVNLLKNRNDEAIDAISSVVEMNRPGMYLVSIYLYDTEESVLFTTFIARLRNANGIDLIDIFPEKKKI